MGQSQRDPWAVEVVIACSPRECSGWDQPPPIDGINRWLADETRRGGFDVSQLVQVNQLSLGNAPFPSPVFVIAFRGVSLPGFLMAAAIQPWQAPAEVQILIKEGKGGRFRVLNGIVEVLSARARLIAQVSPWWQPEAQ